MSLKSDKADEKAQRLAEALRANLRRRKDQARGKRAVSAEAEDTPAPEADET